MAYQTYTNDGRNVETGIDPDAYDRAHPKAPAPPAAKDAQGRPTTGTKPREETPLLGKAAGAKVLQSATFGWGADLAEKTGLVSKQNAAAIKREADNYSRDNPFASAGIDLLVAGATFAIPGVDAVASGRAAVSVARAVGDVVPVLGKVGGAIAKSGIGRVAGSVAGSTLGRGATYGAVQGAAQGSADAGEGNRINGALSGAGAGAVQGGIAGGVLGTVAGRLAKPVTQSVAPKTANFNAINTALRADGITMKQLNERLAADPNLRIADISPRVAKLVAKAGSSSGGAADALGSTLRADAGGRADRLVKGTGEAVADAEPGHATLGRQLPPSKQPYPLDKVRQDVADSLDKLGQQKDALYSQSRTELTPVSKELGDLLAHPDVKPILKESLGDYATLRRMDPSSDVAKAKKFKIGSEIPSAVLDDVQRKLGKLAQTEGTGSTRYGALKAAQAALKKQQTGTVVPARELAARLGNESNDTGLLGAQGFGNAYAQGFKQADIKAFRAMTDEQKHHAAFGMLSGLEQYLHNAARMPVGKMEQIAGALASPEAIEILGKRAASQTAKVFKDEGARMRTNAKMAGAGKAGDDEADKVLSHVAAHTVSHATGLGAVGAGVLRFLMSSGFTEKSAQDLIKTATMPGGMAHLKSRGVPRKVLESLYAMKGTTRAALDNQRVASSRRDDGGDQ